MVRVGINGFGRIGRAVARIILESKDISLVAINSRSTPKQRSYLLKYDSIYRKFRKKVKLYKNTIVVDKHKILCFSKNTPEDIEWNKAGTDIVVEASGIFKDKNEAKNHLLSKVKKVIITAPAFDADLILVLGVNDKEYNPKKHKIISNASCTTNCLAPVCKVLNESFGIKKGFMTTTHAVTGSQRILDGSHKKSLRRGRAAFSSIIPTTTGASKTLDFVMPELSGKIQSTSLRVPIETVSIIDLVVELDKKTTVSDINKAFKFAANNSMKGILGYTEEELVSSDFIGSSFSAVYDSTQTMCFGKMAKVFAWYDNEWGYASRVVDLIRKISK